MQLSNTDKLINRLLWIANAAFITLYFILIYHNRYAADDYFFVYNAKSRGVIGAAAFTAHTWTPRPAEMLLYNTITKYFPEQIVLIGYGLLVLALLSIAVFKLLKIGLMKAGAHLPDFLIAGFALLFCCSFFFASVSIGETWFWLCSSAGYLLSLAAFLWGIIFLINTKNTPLTWLLLLICFSYIMGGAETFAAFVLFLLCSSVLAGLYLYRTDINQLFSTLFFKKLLLITCLCLIELGIVYLDKGTQFRRSLLKQASVPDTFILSAKAIAFLLLKQLPGKLPYLLLFSAPFLWIGKQLASDMETKVLFTRGAFYRVCIAFLHLHLFP